MVIWLLLISLIGNIKKKNYIYKCQTVEINCCKKRSIYFLKLLFCVMHRFLF